MSVVPKRKGEQIQTEKDETKACAWVPEMGMPKSLPASTLLVPSKPPM